MLEKTKTVVLIMKEKLNAEELEILGKMRNEEVKSFNNFERKSFTEKDV